MSHQPSSQSGPGERPPAGTTRLSRPPSDRYGSPSPGDGSGPGATASPAQLPRGPIAAAVGVAVVGAGLLTLILGVLLSTTGTFVVSLLGGAAIGLLIAGLTVAGPPDRWVRQPASLGRAQALRLAVGLAIGMVVLAGFATWLLARVEGGVLDPITYLWTTFGLGIPAQAVVATLAAAWGAASGPVRWRE